jgi:NAD(P)-dependent dehydrogenase (short-subunit alcohol dehydrogenase family)
MRRIELFIFVVVVMSAVATARKMTSYLITGTSKGIGFGLAEKLLTSSPDSYVVATCRVPDGSSELKALQNTYGKDRLLVLQLDTTSLDQHKKVVTEMASNGINSIDVFIANAGISTPNHPVDPILSCPEEDMMAVFRTNCVGTMFGLQCFTPLLLAGKSKVVVLLSSRLASIEQTAGLGGYTSYRASKAALNMLAMTYSEDATIKESGVVTICMHPGWVQTSMGGSGGRKAPVSVADCVAGISDQISKSIAIRKKLSGPTSAATDDPLENALRKNRCVFTAYDGEMLPW